MEACGACKEAFADKGARDSHRQRKHGSFMVLKGLCGACGAHCLEFWDFLDHFVLEHQGQYAAAINKAKASGIETSPAKILFMCLIPEQQFEENKDDAQLMVLVDKAIMVARQASEKIARESAAKRQAEASTAELSNKRPKQDGVPNTEAATTGQAVPSNPPAQTAAAVASAANVQPGPPPAAPSNAQDARLDRLVAVQTQMMSMTVEMLAGVLAQMQQLRAEIAGGGAAVVAPLPAQQLAALQQQLASACSTSTTTASAPSVPAAVVPTADNREVPPQKEEVASSQVSGADSMDAVSTTAVADEKVATGPLHLRLSSTSQARAAAIDGAPKAKKQDVPSLGKDIVNNNKAVAKTGSSTASKEPPIGTAPTTKAIVTSDPVVVRNSGQETRAAVGAQKPTKAAVNAGEASGIPFDISKVKPEDDEIECIDVVVKNPLTAFKWRAGDPFNTHAPAPPVSTTASATPAAVSPSNATPVSTTTASPTRAAAAPATTTVASKTTTAVPIVPSSAATPGERLVKERPERQPAAAQQQNITPDPVVVRIRGDYFGQEQLDARATVNTQPKPAVAAPVPLKQSSSQQQAGGVRAVQAAAQPPKQSSSQQSDRGAAAAPIRAAAASAAKAISSQAKALSARASPATVPQQSHTSQHRSPSRAAAVVPQQTHRRPVVAQGGVVPGSAAALAVMAAAGIAAQARAAQAPRLNRRGRPIQNNNGHPCVAFWTGKSGDKCPECNKNFPGVRQTKRKHFIQEHFPKYFELVRMCWPEKRQALERCIGARLGCREPGKRACPECRELFRDRIELLSHNQGWHRATATAFARDYAELFRQWGSPVDEALHLVMSG